MRARRCVAACILFIVGHAASADEFHAKLPCASENGLLYIAEAAPRVFMVCFSASGGDGHFIDLRSGKVVTTRLEATSRTMTMNLSADGETFARILVDGRALLYSASRAPLTLDAGTPGQWLSFVSGSRLLTMNLRVWDLAAEPRPVATLGGEFGAIRDAAVTPDGRLAAMAGEDTTIRVYDTATWQLRHEIRDSLNTPSAVAFSLDGKRLFVGGVDRLVRLYDAASGVAEKTLQAAGLVADIVVLPDGKSIAVRTELMLAAQPDTWEFVDVESGVSKPACVRERAASELGVIDGEVWCYDVQSTAIDAWTL